MSGTTSYNTLSIVVDDEPKQGTSSRKVAIVAAVVVACCAMFFAGRTVAQPVGYVHEEVINLGAYCEQGQFIGDCQACKECQSFEYDNGGCSFFKDTFCTYCEPIKNCKREQTVCTDRVDQTCTTCDCDDPISSWADVPKELARGSEPTFSCYIGEQCEPCRPCKKGFFETKACNPETNEPTECQQCATCDAGTYVSSECDYFSNTECSPCSTCDAMGARETTETKCTGDPTLPGEINDIFTPGHNTFCKSCIECKRFEFVQDTCTPTTDTVCEQCSPCDQGSFIGTQCLETDSPTAGGADTVCTPCEPLKDPLESAAFLNTLCDPTLESDFRYTSCEVCEYGEYQTKDCEFGDESNLGSDRECAFCAEIVDCAGNNICTTENDQECSRCGEQGADVIEGRDEDYFQTWGTCCARRSLGLSCEWTHHDSGCDEGQKNFMERSAKRGGFTGTSSADFVLWCKLLCEETAECNAFEVPKEIADGTELPVASSLCGLKNHENYDFGSGGGAHTCWSKRTPTMV